MDWLDHVMDADFFRSDYSNEERNLDSLEEFENLIPASWVEEELNVNLVDKINNP